MTTLAFVWPDWLVGLTTVLFLAVCVIMVLTVLIQKPQGGGLASAFGGSGAGSGQTAFGAKTGDALTVFTIIVFVVYLAFAVVLNFAMRPAPLAEEPSATGTTEGGAGGSPEAPATGGAAPEAQPAAPAPAEAPAPSGGGTPTPTEAPKADNPKG
ncbi:MAG: preprotein translocase subunit SecG [Phycisphaerales bacterium]